MVALLYAILIMVIYHFGLFPSISQTGFLVPLGIHLLFLTVFLIIYSKSSYRKTHKIMSGVEPLIKDYVAKKGDPKSLQEKVRSEEDTMFESMITSDGLLDFISSRTWDNILGYFSDSLKDPEFLKLEACIVEGLKKVYEEKRKFRITCYFCLGFSILAMLISL